MKLLSLDRLEDMKLDSLSNSTANSNIKEENVGVMPEEEKERRRERHLGHRLTLE